MKAIKLRRPIRYIDVHHDRLNEPIIDTMCLLNAVAVLMPAFATRLPLLIILDILGIPADDLDTIPGWADGFVDLVWGDPHPAAQLNAAHGFVELWDYCHDIVIDSAALPQHASGLIGDLLRHRDGDDTRLTLDEVAALALNLAVAGWETTSSALGHALEHALVDPDRWQQLATDDHYLATHVEESLRHSLALDGWLRQTTTDITLDGVTIPAGSRCLLLTGTANQDPRTYSSTAQFDPGQAWLSQHPTFGAGPHYCLGAALARLELTTALRTLAQRLPHLRLADDYRRRFRTNAVARTHLTLPASTGTMTTRCPLGNDATVGAQQ